MRILLLSLCLFYFANTFSGSFCNILKLAKMQCLIIVALGLGLFSAEIIIFLYFLESIFRFLQTYLIFRPLPLVQTILFKSDFKSILLLQSSLSLFLQPFVDDVKHSLSIIEPQQLKCHLSECHLGCADNSSTHNSSADNSSTDNSLSGPATTRQQTTHRQCQQQLVDHPASPFSPSPQPCC